MITNARRGFGRAAVLVLAGLGLGGAVPSVALAANEPPLGGYAIGDFNGDDQPDFIARENTYDWSVAFGSPGPGRAKLPSEGGAGVVLDVSRTDDITKGYGFISDPSRVGDVDGDGFGDLVVTGIYGRSWLVYGAAATGTIDVAGPGPRVTTLLHEGNAGTGPWYVSGANALGIGDFNGDGYADWYQDRITPEQPSQAQLAKIGGGVIVLGGSRVAELDTRGTGARRIQVDSRANCVTTYFAFFWPIPSTRCSWRDVGFAAIGDYDGDGKTDLYQPTGKFVVKGRASTATFNGFTADANTTAVPMQPLGDPWTPRGTPPADPGSVGTDGWTLSGGAVRAADGSVNVAPKDYANYGGAVYDQSKLVDANEIVIDFDLTLKSFDGDAGGNGATLAFASKSQGGSPNGSNAGIGLGWVGNRGIAIAFGTVKGTYTPSNNYVGVVTGTVGKSGYPTFLQSAAAGSPLANATNHITVKATGGVLTVSINGVERLRRTMLLPNDAWVGFTGGVSSLRQDHIIKNVVVKKP